MARSLRSLFTCLPIPSGLLLTLFASAPAAQQPGPDAPGAAPGVAAAPRERPLVRHRILVLNKGEATASLFDPETRQEVAVVAVGEGPHEVAVSPDGRTAVVCNYGDQKPGNSLTVIDVPAARAVRTIELVERRPGRDEPVNLLRPHGITFVGPDHVFVTSEVARRLVKVDLPTASVAATWVTPQQTMHMLAQAPRGERIYATSIREGNLSVFELAETTGKTGAAKVLATGAGAEGIAVHPTSGEVWTSNRAADTVTVVDPKRFEVAHTLPAQGFPIRVALTADGKTALVTCAQAGVVRFFDAASKQELGALELERVDGESPMPIGVLPFPDGSKAWVACQAGDCIVEIDVAARRAAHKVPARHGPDGMAWASWQEEAPK